LNEARGERFDIAAEALGRRPGNLRFECEYLFDGIEFEGRSVLDIGAGDGEASFFAACAGAASVVSLEPEQEGSTAGMTSRFDRARELIQADDVELRRETFQAFDPADRRFDVVISLDSINHLDEPACVRLPDDPEARSTYLGLFEKLSGLASPGASLVVADCSRRNLFGDLGLRNPVAPTVEWEKHQPPRVWADLLEETGFGERRIRWNTFNSLRRPGRLLLGNRVAAYLTASTFCLTMQRA
jgi:SAM-dependent methyltransferase